MLEVSVFLLIEMDEIGLAPEVPEDPAPGSDPNEPVRRHNNNTSGMMIKDTYLISELRYYGEKDTH